MNLICAIFGHKWFYIIERDDEPKIGYKTIRHIEMKACIRCCENNPNYGILAFEPKEENKCTS